ncbi:MAG: NAD(P)H-quinone oxidoreductase [Armatimonadota bacterium]
MQAIRIREAGGPDVLESARVERPAPGSGEVLVRVKAAGVNRADILERLGQYPAPPGVPADIPGLEYAGVVQEVGSGELPWRPGDRVMGIVAGGAYAEFVTTDPRHPMRIPGGWTFEEAAAVPEAFLTAHDALYRAVGLRAGEQVLIHAVGSSVGVALLQLAKAAGCSVAGTSRTSDKLTRAEPLGLDRPVLVRDVFDPEADLRSWADVICDLVGGPYLAGNLAAVAPRGRIVVIGLTGGRSGDIDMGSLLRKRVVLVGTTLRNRSADEKAAVVRSLVDATLPQFEDGTLRPVLDRVFPMADASEAHRYVEANRNFGSVVLSWA